MFNIQFTANQLKDLVIDRIDAWKDDLTAEYKMQMYKQAAAELLSLHLAVLDNIKEFPEEYNTIAAIDELIVDTAIATIDDKIAAWSSQLTHIHT